MARLHKLSTANHKSFYNKSKHKKKEKTCYILSVSAQTVASYLGSVCVPSDVKVLLALDASAGLAVASYELVKEGSCHAALSTGWKDWTSGVPSPEDNLFLLQAARNDWVVQCSSMDPEQ